MISKLRRKQPRPETDVPANGRKRKIMLGALAVFVLVAFGSYLHSRGKVTTDDAFVDGHAYAVTPRVPGFVNAVLVEDNQRVAAGDVLVELDPTEYQVALAQARADLAAAESQLAALEMNVPLTLDQTSSKVAGAKAQLESLYKNLDQLNKEEESARQEAAQSQALLEKARLDMERYQSLRSLEMVAQADMDSARTKERTAEAELRSSLAKAEAAARKREALQADAERLKAEIRLAAMGKEQAGIKDKEAQAQRAKVELAREKARQAELNLSYSRIAAPADGFVTKRAVDPGRLVAAGQPLLTVVPLTPDKLWITANFKETQLEGVRPGQAVTVEVDAYPGRLFTGRVDSIMAGTGSAFSLFPSENASGNYVKIVQRVPVKIVLRHEDEPAPDLRLGMSVVPTILVD